MQNKKIVVAEKLEEIVARLRAGTSTLTAESRALGFTHNGVLRMRLREHLGREQYDALDLRGKAQARAAEASER